MKFHVFVFPAFLLMAAVLMSGCGGSSSSSGSSSPDTLIGTLQENLSSGGTGAPTPLAGWTVTFVGSGGPISTSTSSNGTFSLQFTAANVNSTGNQLKLIPPTGYSGPLTTETTTIAGLSTTGEQELIVEVTIAANGTVTVQ